MRVATLASVPAGMSNPAASDVRILLDQDVDRLRLRNLAGHADRHDGAVFRDVGRGDRDVLALRRRAAAERLDRLVQRLGFERRLVPRLLLSSAWSGSQPAAGHATASSVRIRRQLVSNFLRLRSWIASCSSQTLNRSSAARTLISRADAIARYRRYFAPRGSTATIARASASLKPACGGIGIGAPDALPALLDLPRQVRLPRRRGLAYLAAISRSPGRRCCCVMPWQAVHACAR